MISSISAVSVGFMPAVGSSRNSTRGFSDSARAISSAAAVRVGEREGRIVDARHEPLAEQREDLHRVGAQRCLLGLAPKPGRTSASASSPSGPTTGHCGRTAASRVCAPTSTLSSTLRLPNTRPCWNVRAKPSGASFSAGRPVMSRPPNVTRAGVRRVEPGDEVEHRGLAGAVRPDDADELAFVDGERQRVDGGDAAEAARQALRSAGRRHHTVPIRPCGR